MGERKARLTAVSQEVELFLPITRVATCAGKKVKYVIPSGDGCDEGGQDSFIEQLLAGEWD